VTVIAMTELTPYFPSAVVDDTLVTVGVVESWI
jgi:hypothetical protein